MTTMTPPRITASTLAALDIFRNLSVQAREQICPLVTGASYPAGRIIIKQRDPDYDVYFVVSGRVRVRYFSSSGTEVSIRDLGAGKMFGELSAVDGHPRSAEVTAREESFIVTVNPRAFRRLLHSYPEVTDFVLEHLVTSVRALTERVIEFSTLGVKNRIHIELLRLATDAGADCAGGAVIRSTHAEIANKISTTREAVTREINNLTHIDILEKKVPDKNKRGTRLVVKDLDRLARIVEESTGELAARPTSHPRRS